jgi:hypothetical protein
MSRYADYDDWSGSGDSILIILGWFVALLTLYWLTGVLRLSYRLSVFLWGTLNFSPIIWMVVHYATDVLSILGLLVVAGFSYVAGKSVFEQREAEKKETKP